MVLMSKATPNLSIERTSQRVRHTLYAAAHVERWAAQEQRLSMKVKRIMANAATPDLETAAAFYEGILGLEGYRR